MMNDPLLSLRDEFPILSKKTYLISNSLGAMPRSVFTRMKEYADTWAAKGVKAWADEWWEMPITVGNAIAPLIGAREGEISMHPNITTILAIILSCFEGNKRGTRTKIVCEEMNFPSLIYLMRSWTKTHGCELVLVPSRDGVSTDTQEMIDTIDDRTLIVPISHVLFRSGYIQDAQSIIRKAHEVGALVALDAYQSVGILPVDVAQLKVDILVGGVLKWLCGGPGGCFLYVRSDLATALRPRLTGWLAHERPFEFETSDIEYAHGARRFLNGTPTIPSLYAATEGLRIVREAGIDRIRAKSIRQTSLLIDEAETLGFGIRSPRNPSQRGGTVTLDVPHGRAVTRALIERNIIVDYRAGSGIRIAPHFYNTDSEILDTLRIIRDVIDTNAYKNRLNDQTTVT